METYRILNTETYEFTDDVFSSLDEARQECDSLATNTTQPHRVYSTDDDGETFEAVEETNHREGCSCGSPECPQWLADQEVAIAHAEQLNAAGGQA